MVRGGDRLLTGVAPAPFDPQLYETLYFNMLRDLDLDLF